ncbi:MAG: hydrogenase maturation protease [Crenarchaeota archaeon]|jgi:hydrogenase 3 maturation protease|nr:hydrogenase maturation protease [Thermoproteota archaeon]
MADTVEKDLKDWLADKKRVVVVGVGNPIRQDDNVGLKVLAGLQGKLPSNVGLFECEMVPEGYLLDIEEFKPSHVLLIDAAVLGRKPGDADLVKVTEVAVFSAVSSHRLPLRLFCEYIEKSTGAKIRLLLIEPKTMEFGEELSPELQVAAENLTQTLLKLLG